MPEIKGDLRSFTVAPTRCAALGTFCCGIDGSRAEIEVDKLVAEYHSGVRSDAEIRVTKDSSGALVGVTGFGLEPTLLEHPQLSAREDYAYISLVGLSKDFRGFTKGGSPLGDVLLTDVLEQIESKWGDRIRGVLAQLDPRNDHARELAERHGFEEVFKAAERRYDSWYRLLTCAPR